MGVVMATLQFDNDPARHSEPPPKKEQVAWVVMATMIWYWAEEVCQDTGAE